MGQNRKILICGLPGTGKTTLAKQLVVQLSEHNKNVWWLNADIVRTIYNDWNFTPEGRIRQAVRMKELAEIQNADFVICDFVAPTEEIRSIFGADYTIWMNTENTSQYEDTNKMFEQPKSSDFTVLSKDDNIVPIIVQDILQRL